MAGFLFVLEMCWWVVMGLVLITLLLEVATDVGSLTEVARVLVVSNRPVVAVARSSKYMYTINLTCSAMHYHSPCSCPNMATLRINKKLGKHAVVSAPWKFVRPRAKVKTARPNDFLIARGEFEVTGIDYERDIDGTTGTCLTLSCADIPDTELICRVKNAKLLKRAMWLAKTILSTRTPRATTIVRCKNHQ